MTSVCLSVLTPAGKFAFAEISAGGQEGCHGRDRLGTMLSAVHTYGDGQGHWRLSSEPHSGWSKSAQFCKVACCKKSRSLTIWRAQRDDNGSDKGPAAATSQTPSWFQDEDMGEQLGQSGRRYFLVQSAWGGIGAKALAAALLGEGLIWPEASLALPRPDVGPEVLSYFKTPSGVKVQEIVEGSGSQAGEGDTVEFNVVCRRSNGYFVYSTVDPFSGDAEPAEFPLGRGQMIVGLEEVLAGMRPGGKRRALVPPEVGYVNRELQPQPKEFGPNRSLFAHAKEPLVFEVQLLKVKK